MFFLSAPPGLVPLATPSIGEEVEVVPRHLHSVEEMFVNYSPSDPYYDELFVKLQQIHNDLKPLNYIPRKFAIEITAFQAFSLFASNSEQDKMIMCWPNIQPTVAFIVPELSKLVRRKVLW